MRKHWYKLYVHSCPVCGSEKVYRERQYTPRPPRREDRVSWSDFYDYCLDVGFL